MGFDEDKKEPMKTFYAIQNLKKCLKPEGKLIITVPIGYNLYMDNLFKNGKIKPTEMLFLKRISIDNKWTEATWNEVKNAKYNQPFMAANALIIATFKKD